jgi:hypothetical protein
VPRGGEGDAGLRPRPVHPGRTRDLGTPRPPPSAPCRFEKRYDNLPPADAHLQKISDHVSAYLAIVKGQLLATVPKAIVHCMVRPGSGPSFYPCTEADTRACVCGTCRGNELCVRSVSRPAAQVVPAKAELLTALQEEMAGKEEPQLRRLINESEEIAEQRETIKKRLTLLQRASNEIQVGCTRDGDGARRRRGLRACRLGCR